jgi:hypothetical protein
MGSGRKSFLKDQWKDKPYCPLRKISLEKVKAIENKK